MAELTKKQAELAKLCDEVKKEIEAQIFNFDVDDINDLKYLGAIYLTYATKIFISTQGFNRTKIAMQRYATDLTENS